MGYHRRITMTFIFKDIIAIKSKLSAHREKETRWERKKRKTFIHFLARTKRSEKISLQFAFSTKGFCGVDWIHVKLGLKFWFFFLIKLNSFLKWKIFFSVQNKTIFFLKKLKFKTRWVKSFHFLLMTASDFSSFIKYC